MGQSKWIVTGILSLHLLVCGTCFASVLHDDPEFSSGTGLILEDDPAFTNGSVTPQAAIPADVVTEANAAGEHTDVISEPASASATVAPAGPAVNYFCQFPKPYDFGRFKKPTLIASKWSAVGKVQAALNLPVNGQFTRQLTDAIKRYQSSRGLEAHGCIDTRLMQALLPSETHPDYKERARQLSFLFEGTDYDKVEFNWPGGDGTNDGQGITWGPTGMTLASGEVTAILKLVFQDYRSDMVSLLGQSDANSLENISRQSTANAMRLVRRTYFDPGRSSRARLKAIFAKLGTHAGVRSSYDRISERSINDKMRLYTNYLKQFTGVTELDYAMFYDISVQTGSPQSKIRSMQARINPSTRLTGSARRKIWGQTISSKVSSAWRKNRELRNQSFYSESAMAGRYGLAERPITL